MLSKAYAPSRLPREMGDITAAFLTDALRRAKAVGPSTRVVAFATAFLSDGVGQTGVVARLFLDYDGPSGPASLIAKLPTADQARREASVVSGLYSREVGFYARVASHVNMRTPRAYFAEIDEAGEFFLLLLEDFPDHRPGDQVVGSTRQEAEAAMVQLARLHSPYWDRSVPVTLPQPGYPPLTMYERAWAQTEASFGSEMSAEFKSLRQPYLASIAALDRWKEASPITLIHGDFKADNLLYRGTGDHDMVALDWQAMCLGRAAVDIAYFNAHNLTVETRREIERGLLCLYLQELQAGGVSYTMTQILSDYRMSLAYLLGYAVWICGINIVDHPRAILRKKNLMRRVSASIQDPVYPLDPRSLICDTMGHDEEIALCQP